MLDHGYMFVHYDPLHNLGIEIYVCVIDTRPSEVLHLSRGQWHKDVTPFWEKVVYVSLSTWALRS